RPPSRASGEQEGEERGMGQVLFRFPVPWSEEGLPLHGFGVMLCLAFLATIWLANRRAPREGISRDTIEDIAIWLFLGGLLGARLVSMFTKDPPDYPPLASPSQLGGWFYRLISIWDGGIVLYGSILGGAAGFFLAYFLYYRKKGLHVLRFMDVAAPCVALGLVLGRVGCFLNGCCYGQPACVSCPAVTPVHFPMGAPPRDSTVRMGHQTVAGFTTNGQFVGKVDPDSPAGKAGLVEGSRITAVNGKPTDDAKAVYDLLGDLREWRPHGQTRLDLAFVPPKGEERTITIWPTTIGLYPTQLYEVMSMLLMLLVLLAYFPLRHNPGQVMAALMVGYGIHRWLNELLRDDPRPKGFESYGSLILIVGGVLMWTWLAFRPAEPPPTPLEEPGGGKPQGDAGAVDQNIGDRPAAPGEGLQPLR
ncbi:MAG: prolipoprotein diacylglyceryl transferase, partial [Gemmataceae bacterium]|nr:prolipoprotein diacylglyceryl transferase [Gemmataceae bacterium]